MQKTIDNKTILQQLFFFTSVTVVTDRQKLAVEFKNKLNIYLTFAHTKNAILCYNIKAVIHAA